MPPDTYSSTNADQPLLPTLRRFLPFLWPAGQPALKLRIVGAMLLVVTSKLVQVFGAAFTLKYAVDRMASGDRGALTLVVLLVVGLAAGQHALGEAQVSFGFLDVLVVGRGRRAAV